MKIEKKIVLSICLVVGMNSFVKAQLNNWNVLTNKFNNVVIRDIHVQGDRIMAVGTDLGVYDPCVIHSSDYGITWDSTIYNRGYIFRGIGFADDKVGIITSVNSYSCVLRTTDGGVNWNWQWCDSDSSFHGVNRVTFLDAMNGYMFGWGKIQFDDGVMYKTTDGGISWSHVTGNIPNKPIEYCQFFDLQHGYIGSNLFGNSQLRRTDDGGQTWTDIPGIDTMSFSDAHFLDYNTGFMAAGGSIYKTLDAGNSWQLKKSYNGFAIMSIRFADENLIVAAGTNSSFKGEVSYSTDGGETWAKATGLPVCSEINKVHFFKEYFYLVTGEGEILRSEKVDITLSAVSEISETNTLNVFPNPTALGNSFYVDIKNVERRDVTILNMAGQEIDFDMVSSDNGQSIKVNQRGTFILTVNNEFEIPIQKVIVVD